MKSKDQKYQEAMDRAESRMKRNPEKYISTINSASRLINIERLRSRIGVRNNVPTPQFIADFVNKHSK